MDNKQIYTDTRKELESRKKDLKDLNELNDFLSEIGQRDTEATTIAAKAEIQINQIDKALKKRGA